MDPLAGSAWSDARTVAGFAQGTANATLLQCAADELLRARSGRLLDIGCGAGRNAVPLAERGWHVLGTDLSWPMLQAAGARAEASTCPERLRVALAPMEALPVRDGVVDFLVAHGIWNLSPSAAMFRLAVREAARVARRDAALFVFTFSRTTLAADVMPVEGEPFVFTQFSGQPQCFLTAEELVAELGAAGFAPDPALPLREHNAPRPGALPQSATGPVIHEGLFRRV